MVRTCVLQVLLSLLLAIAVVAGAALPCAACSDMPAQDAAMAGMASGMDDCHHTPAKSTGQPGKAFSCPHCFAFGCGVLVPASSGFQDEQSLTAPPVASLAQLWVGLLTLPDTGPPRGTRS